MVDFTIDPEFRDLLRPLSDEEFTKLRENISRNGIMTPLLVWNGILIDGHNRFEISKMDGVKFEVREIAFPSRDEAFMFIVTNQIARRNLTVIDRLELAEKSRPVLERLAAQNVGGRPKTVSTSGQGFEAMDLAHERIDVLKRIGKIAGVGKETANRFRVIRANDPDAIERIRSGETTIGAEYKRLDLKSKEADEVARIFAKSEIAQDADVAIETAAYGATELLAKVAVVNYSTNLTEPQVAKLLSARNTYLVVISTLKELDRVHECATAQRPFVGAVVLNYGGQVKLAHVFGYNKTLPAIVQQDTLEECLAAALKGLVEPGDIVAAPYTQDTKIALALKRLKAKATVFCGMRVLADEIEQGLKAL